MVQSEIVGRTVTGVWYEFLGVLRPPGGDGKEQLDQEIPDWLKRKVPTVLESGHRQDLVRDFVVGTQTTLVLSKWQTAETRVRRARSAAPTRLSDTSRVEDADLTVVVTAGTTGKVIPGSGCFLPDVLVGPRQVKMQLNFSSPKSITFTPYRGVGSAS
jgi:hypothetical protein